MTFSSTRERDERRGEDNVADAYKTEAVETRDDGWTAKISRTARSESGAVKTSSTLVEVGSISYLIAAARERHKAEIAE
jgi:hypothetical protein